MKANPSKYQALVLARNNKANNIQFELPNGVLLEPSSHVKLLGLLIDSNLNFSTHIAKLTVKCAKQTNAIARLSRILSSDCKLTLFNAFILSNLQYCSPIYHHCSVHDTLKLERIQKRCLRYLCNDFTSDYHELLSKCELPTLFLRRVRSILECVFKILHQQLPPMNDSFFTRTDRPYDFRQAGTLALPPFCTVRFGFKSLHYYGAKQWNNLPNDLRNLETLEMFSSHIKTWSFLCSCQNCILCRVNSL